MSERTQTFGYSKASDRPKDRPGLVTLFSEADIPGDGIFFLGQELTIGRSLDCLVFFEDSAMSRLHAVITRAAGKLTLRDEGSHNGTHVNGRRITGNVPVSEGTLIRCGSTLLLVVADTESFRGWRTWGPEGALVGGPAMESIYRSIEALAHSDLEILVTGESGTGKELVATEIHRISDRCGRLIPVNCAALPETLIEAELFGATKGAFTGATSDRQGFLQAAEGGTLFLDEVGELPLTLQPKLLRALDSKESWPLGSRKPVQVDFRLVAATNRDLDLEVEEGRFRQDLLYRLKGAHISIPPLRHRVEDVALLAECLLAKHCNSETGPCMGSLAMERLLLHNWPGNVRELERALRESLAKALADDDANILPAHLRQDLVQQEQPARPEHRLEEILELLKAERGNVSRVAAALGLHRAQVYRLLQRKGLNAADFR